MKRAAIDVIEAAYQTEGTTEGWLRQIAGVMPERRDGRGHVCLTYQVAASGLLRIDKLVQHGTPGDLEAVSRAGMGALSPEFVRATWLTLPCGTAVGSSPVEVRDQVRADLKGAYGPFGIVDTVVVNGIDPTQQGVYIGALTSREATVSRRERSTWSRVAAHLVASYRLRRMQDAEPDAVITPAGKVEHAIEDARSASARESLRTAALAIDRARMRRGSIDEEDAVEMWQALVEGRWTLVDRIDRDGRRYFVARKNDPDVARHHELTRRERQVVGFAALGHSNKLIAYELGLSISAVAVYLDIAMEKLGVGSRAELIVAARAFGAEP